MVGKETQLDGVRPVTVWQGPNQLREALRLWVRRGTVRLTGPTFKLEASEVGFSRY